MSLGTNLFCRVESKRLPMQISLISNATSDLALGLVTHRASENRGELAAST